MDDCLCVGVIIGAHGVEGVVRIKSFTEDPASIADFGELTDEAGRKRFRLGFLRETKGIVLAKLDGVRDRNAAEALKDVKLMASRNALPETVGEDEFYISELIGLRAVGVDGEVLGAVKGVADFGAGDIVEISLESGGSLLVPFTKEAVPLVDIKGKRVVIDPPSFIETGEGGTDDDAK